MVERGPLRQQDLDAVLESAHEAFVSMDEAGRVVAWNPEAERTFGWARERALGEPLRDLIIPERYRARHEQGLRRFLETGEGPLLDRRIEISAVHRSGHEFPVEMTISALERDGRTTFNAFIRDISDRYRAQEAQARLATLVEHSADAVIGRSADGTVTSWNPAAERLYGYSAREMLGGNVDRLVPPERAGEARELLRRVLTGEAVQDFATVRIRRDGTRVDVSITISPVRDDAGRVADIAMIVRDITERKAAERALAEANEELRRLNELKSHFVAVASHELRTPLTSVGGFATTLLARWEQFSDEDRRRFVGTIEQEAGRLHRLVEDLLTVSRIESGAAPAPSEPVDVGAVAREVIEQLGLGDDTTLTLRGTTIAWASPDHVRRIALNLLENARRYGRPPLHVRTEADAHEVHLRVCDSGDGVAEEFRPYLFERFTQDPSRRGHHRGSGLGLAIVKGLAETAGGQAWFEPNEPAGSRFCVRLPRAAAT